MDSDVIFFCFSLLRIVTIYQIPNLEVEIFLLHMFWQYMAIYLREKGGIIGGSSTYRKVEADGWIETNHPANSSTCGARGIFGGG